MRTVTKHWRWLGLLLLLAGFATTAHAQTRSVTLTLNMATVPDTTRTDSFIEVRGAVQGVSPITLADGNVIDWSDASTLEPQNVGGDYWQLEFQIADTTDLTFKFYSQQLQDIVGEGWEADPNPNIPPGANDTTLVVHFFESQREYRGAEQDRGPYDWRPYEAKEDSIAVWFRVAMFGGEADMDDYDPAAEAPAQQVGVRGDNLDVNGDGSVLSPVDWGITQVVLDRESTNGEVPGYNLYSGVAYYPTALVGQVQNYKFVLDNDDLTDGNVAFEEGNVSGNRTFTIPAQDTTLHWVYYGDTAPTSVEPVESLLLFAVDLSPLEEIGLFDPARGDTLWVFGGFNGWQNCPDTNPDDCLMQRVPGEDQFEAAVLVTQIPGTSITYKYFLDFNDETFMDAFSVEPPSGWEEGHATGTNRAEEFAGQSQQDLGLQFFNDVTSNNVIPEGVSVDVTFEVDMTPALTNDADPFEPAAGDSVTIRAGDPVWAFTQGFTEDPRSDSDFPLFIEEFILTDDDGDNVYAGTYTVTGPTYSALTFRYAYGQGNEFTEDNGTDTNTPGRNRTFYIKKNADGSWPSTYPIPSGAFQVEQGPLPFEANPDISTAIEVVDDEVPSRISLGQNYPNPFNPSTTFEYTLDKTQRVTLRVYDLLGRAVATLVDGLQPASTYRVTFDAADLASGVYFYRLETPTTAITRRMLLMK